MTKESFGLVAKELRVKVTKEPRLAGQFTIIGGQIGFKQKDGSWVNRWVDVWARPDVLKGRVFSKGSVFKVWGRYTESEREYQGKRFEDRSIWADEIDGQGANPMQSRPTPQQQGRFPETTGGMDDVPF